MTQVTYIEYDGNRHVVEVPNGISVMEGAVRSNIPGIVAECGGACACATCHVIVPPEWVAVTGEPSSTEKAMLDFVEGAGERSRLSCQVIVTPACDGLTIQMPEHQ